MESDLKERFFCPRRGRLRKNGAQTAVHLLHEPSGLGVSCQGSTSQALNRFVARRQLVCLLERRENGNVEKAAPHSSDPNGGIAELPVQHMFRMFTRCYEKDVARPFPISATRLSGSVPFQPKLVRLMGEREGRGE